MVFDHEFKEDTLKCLKTYKLNDIDLYSSPSPSPNNDASQDDTMNSKIIAIKTLNGNSSLNLES